MDELDELSGSTNLGRKIGACKEVVRAVEGDPQVAAPCLLYVRSDLGCRLQKSIRHGLERERHAEALGDSDQAIELAAQEVSELGLGTRNQRTPTARDHHDALRLELGRELEGRAVLTVACL